ncbi:hypothetical protein [Candidatus Parabeggiatoa sp. HSG14]|uniref:hypothetical protein n=1 Tax=Candidatus Parabeggiatoa sp. HSG14 TaxID=3055593 RepID=UPI0025A7E25C|nr:hypothetical protein [Thiotrichales bacterium HSG14]
MPKNSIWLLPLSIKGLISKTTNHTRWRTVIISLLMVAVVNFTNVSYVHAGECSGWDIFTLGISCLVKLAIKKGAESAGRGIAKGIRPDFDKMVDDASQKLVDHLNNSVNWENIGQGLGKGASKELLAALNSIDWKAHGQQVGAGIRQEFEATMDKLFDEKLKPLLMDIDNLLKDRINQADEVAKARIQQLDNLIDDKLKKVDVLIQHTIDQFQVVVDETISKVRTDIIDYTFDRFAAERDKTVDQIRTEIIDYATDSVNKTTDEIVAKVKAELIDHTFVKITQLQYQFRQDVEHFFNRAENVIVLLDCTEEKIRLDLERTREELDQLGEKYLNEVKDLMPQAQMSKLFSPGGQPSTKLTTSTSTNNSCYQQLGVTKEALEGFEYSTIYDLKKCKLLNTLTPQTPTRRIQNVYWDLHMFAKRVACIQRNPTHFMWDWMAFESLYHFWSTYR